MSALSRRGFLCAAVASAVPLSFGNPAQAQTLLEGPGPVELGRHATHIQLIGDGVSFAGRRAFLLLTGLTTNQTTGTRYGVYLHPMRDLSATRDRARRIGEIVFVSGQSMEAVFDVTGYLRQQKGGRLIVSIVPDGKALAGAAPVIGGLCLVGNRTSGHAMAGAARRVRPVS